MSQRDGFQPGVPSWVAVTGPDPERAVAFYTGLFGWQATGTGPYAVCTLDGRDVAAIGAPLGSDSPAWRTYVWVESADDAAARATAAGGRVVTGPHDLPGLGRTAVLADPAGAVFGVWQPDEHRGAQVVNEAGAWAMSALTSPEPAAAEAFYGAAFGWQADTFAMGDLEIPLWRLPGFVGGEPQQPVPRDVIATGEPGEQAGWRVDFWVADIDATTAKAAELGGSVLAGPIELPIGRTAMLADPQGATFSVSQLVAP